MFDKGFTAARGCRIAVWGVLGLVALLCVCVPGAARWFIERRFLRPEAVKAMVIAFYPCAASSVTAFVLMLKLLNNIIAGKVFIRTNVQLIKGIAVCCALVSLICLPAGFFYLGLFFVTLIMAFLCLVVCVVGSLMSAAVELREENDLTI